MTRVAMIASDNRFCVHCFGTGTKETIIGKKMFTEACFFCAGTGKAKDKNRKGEGDSGQD